MTRPTKSKARAAATAQQIKDGKQSTLWNVGQEIVDLTQEVSETRLNTNPIVSSRNHLIGKIRKSRNVCRHYNNNQREKITKMYHELKDDGKSLPDAVLQMRTTESGCSLLSEKTMRRWLQQDSGSVVKKKRGVKLNEEFEDAVISGLVVSHVVHRISR